MPAPLIGLTTRNAIDPKNDYPIITSPKSYTQALIRAGALPVLVPVNLPVNRYGELIERLDGIIFTGGGDIDLHRYAGEPHKRVYGIDHERDQMEFDLVREIIQTKLPFLGICRGFQVINVALGGTLYSHIADQLPGALTHDCYPSHPTDHIAHTVTIKPQSQLAEILGSTEVAVNSLHHQGVKTLSNQLEALAWATDGLLEAASLPGHPFGLAVQWHPEWMPDDQRMQSLFDAFLDAANAYRAAR